MDNTLFISDPHIPYEHPDSFRFLMEVYDAYDCTQAMSVGDLADNHAPSFHEIEYGVLSAEDEFLQTRDKMQELEDMFGNINVSLGNHCIMGARKAKQAGIPLDFLKSYNTLYGVEFTWRDNFWFPVRDEKDMCLMIHTSSASVLNIARTHSHNLIQGHHHSVFGIEYFSDKLKLRWAMSVGCLIDPNHPAFNYAKGATSKRPILGCGVVLDNVPILVPMVLNDKGSWTGELYAFP